jgi:L-rhamnose isomerase
MSGNIGTIVVKVNKACDDLDFINARGLIEANLLKLSESKYYRLLNASGRVLIKHVLANSNGQNEVKKTLTRTDLLVINKINEYCSNFDISMLKRTLKNSFELVQRSDVLPLLNNDAKIILDDMGALLGVHQLH